MIITIIRNFQFRRALGEKLSALRLKGGPEVEPVSLELIPDLDDDDDDDEPSIRENGKMSKVFLETNL